LAFAQIAQAVAEVLDVACFDSSTSTSGIHCGVTVAKLRDESGLRDVEVTAALVHFLRALSRKGHHSVTT